MIKDNVQTTLLKYQKEYQMTGGYVAISILLIILALGLAFNKAMDDYIKK